MSLNHEDKKVHKIGEPHCDKPVLKIMIGKTFAKGFRQQEHVFILLFNVMSLSKNTDLPDSQQHMGSLKSEPFQLSWFIGKGFFKVELSLLRCPAINYVGQILKASVLTLVIGYLKE